ncbi:YkvA family protein [Brevundimonas sp. DC300-4]|uniref:YkvA family protein n=1 Tax=Brevundimonas sp. DC300-4 TaxID=2804594 RepID=UPI003CE9DD55
MWKRLRDWARTIKRDVVMLWLAARDPRTPWQAKLLAGAVAAYALSPIDLIPDFIPVLGYLDDVVLVPVGIWLAVKLMPVALVVELRARAEAVAQRPTSRGAAIVVVVIWMAAAMGLGLAAWMISRPHLVQ